MIPHHLQNADEIVANKILVYLPFEETAKVETVLREFDSHDFYIYGKVGGHADRGHLHLRPFSRSGFLKDLAECNGVISNAGFELPSEALHLGKRILVKPLAGQMEQVSNSLALTIMNLAMAMPTMDGIPSSRATIEQ